MIYCFELIDDYILNFDEQILFKIMLRCLFLFNCPVVMYKELKPEIKC